MVWIVTGTGKLLRSLENDRWPFILVDKLFSHIEGIILGEGKKVDEVAGGASGMGVDRIGEVGEGQAVRGYGAGFTAGSLARVGTRDTIFRTIHPIS